MSTSRASRAVQFARGHLMLLLILAVLAWAGLATYLAAERGSRRQMSFNGALR